ncbi:acetylglutamate kinase [Bacillus sp. Marseille-P3661]|uniref:acetylglutamate kinase n=1 Tax=Bacillus sp. Marseille-P3661 TaxID=1936234 RepID=UPI000C8659FA|nr:acetylglutamate kinase [Bacillus sp. Marseille-P3661]
MEDIVLIKCGGSTLENLSDDFFQSIAELMETGKKPVIVHGGGPEIKKTLSDLNVESEFVDGLRKTTEEVLDVVEMVLAGRVNKDVVTNMQRNGVKAIGLSGVDGELLKVKAIDIDKLGYVGEVINVNSALIHDLLTLNYVPVIAPIGIDNDYKKFNINADTAAGAIAKSLAANQLLFVTDVPGILKDGELIPVLTAQEVLSLIEDGTIYGGMIPKVKSALDSLTGNLQEIIIVDGKSSKIVNNGQIIGTKIIKEHVNSI